MIPVFQACGGVRKGGAPEKVTNEVVFADVVGEEIYACWSTGVGGERIEVRAAEHGGFADDAGSDGDGVDGDVHLGVGGREKEFFQTASECGC